MNDMVVKLEDSIATSIEGGATDSETIKYTVESFSNIPPFH